MTFNELKIALETVGYVTLKNKNNEIKDYDCLCYTNGEWHAANGWSLNSEDVIGDLTVPDYPEQELDAIINDGVKSDSDKISDIVIWKNKHAAKLQ